MYFFSTHLLVFPYNPELNLGVQTKDNITIELNENDYLYPKLVGDQKLLDVDLKEFLCWKNGFKLLEDGQFEAEKFIVNNFDNKTYKLNLCQVI